MTWQDELQKLDNELASGRISADDYRRRRDEVLAASAGGSAPQAPQQQQGPFAPPFKWEAKPPSFPNPDATQVVSSGQQQPQQQQNPDATQVVSTSQPKQDADRTQFVAPVTPPPGNNWGQSIPPPNSAPPWAAEGFEQISQPNPGWSHGPEVFDESSSGGKGKIIGIVVAVVLLAGIGFGAYWLWGRGPSTTTTTQSSNPPASETSAKPTTPPDPLQIGKIAGNPQERKDITDFAQVEALKPPYLTGGEIAAYKTGGGAKSKLSTATPAKGSNTAVLVVEATDDSTARICATELKDIQITNGMQAVADGIPTEVAATQIDAKDGQPARIRGHYASKQYVVRIDVTAPTLAETMTLFKAALDAQLKAMPADA